MQAGRGTVLIAIVAALVLGVGAGVVLDRTRSKPQPVVLPVSQWSSAADGTKIVAGSLAADPKRGVVLFEDRRLGPSLYSMPTRSGPLHLVSSTYGSWVLETSQGARAVLQFADDQGRPAFEMLGPQLDPGHLPALTRQGLAVPVVYGPKRVKAVLLVGARNPYTFPVYGYLAGFSVPPAKPSTAALARPLLGPDHRLYRVDRASRRLVPVGRSLERAPAPSKIPPRCSTWPTTAGRVLACAASIELIRPDGKTTLLRQPGISQSNTRWVFVSSSPNGRTLLLEQDIYACGADRQTYFLSTNGGALRRAVGDVATQSEPLGWLGGGAALVAIQYGECDGAARSGLYRAYPDGSDGLIVATSGQDATLWGSQSGPLTSAF
jgi:hypothetical protein